MTIDQSQGEGEILGEETGLTIQKPSTLDDTLYTVKEETTKKQPADEKRRTEQTEMNADIVQDVTLTPESSP